MEQLHRLIEGLRRLSNEPVFGVPKANCKVRICFDLTPLNKAVQREIHPMATVDENLAKVKGSQVFSKLALTRVSGKYTQSRLLTTFITPFSRFCFNRLPFGISSAPEIFQRTMTGILQGLEGIVCHMDDILVHGVDQGEHDQRVRAVLQRLQAAGLTLNEKCESSKTRITFLGHIITSKGIEADPEKTTAVREFPTPGNITELQRFNGMVNQLSKFLPELAIINEPLRQLLRKDREWIWDSAQKDAFNAIKEALVSTPVLAHYDPKRQTIVAADACQNGLGAVLLQVDADGNKRPICYAFNAIKEALVSTPVLAHYDPKRQTIVAADACQNGLGAVLLQVDADGNKRPICYASRSLTDAETRYAVIEKEALAATWACEKFSDYILGMSFTLETDHKPLVPLLSTTDLDKMPPRVLRFRLRMMRFSPVVIHVQGKGPNNSRCPVTCSSWQSHTCRRATYW